MMIGMGFSRTNPRDRTDARAPVAPRRFSSASCVWVSCLLGIVTLVIPQAGRAQVRYVTRFTLEKQTFLLGEPIFCQFTIQNTGTRPFAFAYRTPSRVTNPELQGEPDFSVRDASGSLLPDPAAKPCGGAKGSVVYGSVTLPPGQTHTERWLANQWARFSRPGRYQVRAERRLPLLGVKPGTQEFSEQPVGYALAIDELSLVVTPSSRAQLEAAFHPYVKILDKPTDPKAVEAVLVLTTLPQPFLLKTLVALTNSPARNYAWDRQQALEGLARLGTPAAWQAILKMARSGPTTPSAPASKDEALRAHAILLLGEKGDREFVPPLLQMVSTAPESLRDDVLRALGFFDDPRANQVLFEKLHSPREDDRVNAVLGLRNLERKDVVPALIAMLSDPDSRVRQVAHFALLSLTGRKADLSAGASASESARVAEWWRVWWREHGASFVPAPNPPCRDW
jgi:HEAT repeat protein